jgi:hypothetical protein
LAARWWELFCPSFDRRANEPAGIGWNRRQGWIDLWWLVELPPWIADWCPLPFATATHHPLRRIAGRRFAFQRGPIAPTTAWEMRWQLHAWRLCRAVSVRTAQRESDRFRAQNIAVGEVTAQRTCQWKQSLEQMAHRRTVSMPRVAKALRKLASAPIHFSLRPLLALASPRRSKLSLGVATA